MLLKKSVSVRNTSKTDKMAKLLVALALVAFVAHTQALPRAMMMWPSRIVGGEKVDIGKAPHQISMRRSGSHICGGSILNSRTVLTAAHCCEAITSISSCTIRAGLNTLNNPEAGYQESGISSIIRHPAYSPTTLNNDVCLLKLSSTLVLGESSRTQAIRLPASNPAPGSNVNVTGWGTTSESGSISQALLTVTVQVISNDECQTKYGSSYPITKGMICAGTPAGGKDSCQGDSGGPMVYGTFGSETQVGVVSWGIGCARPQYPGVYANVLEYVSWIIANA